MARKLCIANLIVLQIVNCPHRTNAFIICLLSHQFSYDTWNKSSVDIKYANIYLPLCYYYISTCRKNNYKTTNVFSSYCNNKITMKSLDHTQLNCITRYTNVVLASTSYITMIRHAFVNHCFQYVFFFAYDRLAHILFWQKAQHQRRRRAQSLLFFSNSIHTLMNNAEMTTARAHSVVSCI